MSIIVYVYMYEHFELIVTKGCANHSCYMQYIHPHYTNKEITGKHAQDNGHGRQPTNSEIKIFI